MASKCPGSRGNLFFPQLTKQGVRGRPRVRIHHIGRQPACADWSPEELRWADASWTASDSGGTASDTDSQAEEEDDEEEPSGAPATRHVRWADQQQEGERARGPSVHLGPPCAGRVPRHQDQALQAVAGGARGGRCAGVRHHPSLLHMRRRGVPGLEHRRTAVGGRRVESGPRPGISLHLYPACDGSATPTLRLQAPCAGRPGPSLRRCPCHAGRVPGQQGRAVRAAVRAGLQRENQDPVPHLPVPHQQHAGTLHLELRGAALGRPAQPAAGAGTRSGGGDPARRRRPHPARRFRQARRCSQAGRRASGSLAHGCRPRGACRARACGIPCAC